MIKKHIPLFRPSYDHRELDSLKEPFEKGWIGLGPKTKEFEDKFAAFVGSTHAVAVNSATSGLHLALSLFNIKGKEVITTSLTFVSTNHAILYEQGIPVFCDIERDTLNMDAKKIEALITPKTVGIICVDYGGHACDMDKIMAIAKKHNLFVIEDAAHACGSMYKKKRVGNVADITSFSFHAVKNLAMGDGGMLTFNNAEWDAILRRRRWLGISKSTYERNIVNKGYHWQYDVEELGYKYHMNDINACLGLVQLSKLEKANDKRRSIAAMYDKELKEVKWLTLPVEKPYTRTVRHNYAVRIHDPKLRSEFIGYMMDNNIATGVHYSPNHQFKMYRKYKADVPVTESEWQKIVLLPVFPGLTTTEQKYVIKTIKNFKK